MNSINSTRLVGSCTTLCTYPSEVILPPTIPSHFTNCSIWFVWAPLRYPAKHPEASLEIQQVQVSLHPTRDSAYHPRPWRVSQVPIQLQNREFLMNTSMPSMLMWVHVWTSREQMVCHWQMELFGVADLFFVSIFLTNSLTKTRVSCQQWWLHARLSFPVTLVDG